MKHPTATALRFGDRRRAMRKAGIALALNRRRMAVAIDELRAYKNRNWHLGGTTIHFGGY